MTKEEIQLIISGKNAGAVGALKGSTAAVQEFSSKTIGDFKKITGAVFNLRNAVVGGALAMAIKKITDLGDEIDKGAQRAQISAGEYQVLTHALELGGAGAGDLETAMKKLSSTIYDADRGLAESKDALDALGLSSRELMTLTPYEQFNRVTQALAKMEPGAKRSALMQDILGRSGLALIPVLNATGGNLDTLADKMRRNGQIMSDEQVKKSAAWKDAWTELNRVLSVAAMEALEPVITDLQQAIMALVESGQLAEWGRDAGEVMRDVVAAVRQLAEFVAEHRETLISLGMTYVGIRILSDLNRGLTAGTAALKSFMTAQVAAKSATAGTNAQMTSQLLLTSRLSVAFGSVGAALRSTAALGAAAFVGWQIGRAIGDLTGLDKYLQNTIMKLDVLKKTMADAATPQGNINAQMDANRQAARRQYQNKYQTTEGFDQFWAVRREETLARLKAEQAAKGAAAPGAASSPETAIPAAVAEAETAAAMAMDAAAEAAKRQARELERLQERETSLVETMRSEAEARDIQQARDAELAAIDETVDALQREAQAQSAAAQAAQDAADKKIAAANEAWQAVVAGDIPSGDDERAAARQARQQAQAEAKAERDLAIARERQEAGRNLSRRQKALIGADDQRIAAAAAQDVARGEELKIQLAEQALAAARDQREQQVANYLQQDQAAELAAQTVELAAIRDAIANLNVSPIINIAAPSQAMPSVGIPSQGPEGVMAAGGGANNAVDILTAIRDNTALTAKRLLDLGMTA